MREIESDIERNDGVYPYSEGEISTAEVLRRAGLSTAALQKPRHRETRDSVNNWVKAVQLKIKHGSKVVRREITERAQVAKREVAGIRQSWVEAELEYIETTAKLAQLSERYARLEEENARLRAALAGENVVTIGPHSKNWAP
jgi:hypothetical protein